MSNKQNKYNEFNTTKAGELFKEKSVLKRAEKVAKTGDRHKIIKISEFNIVNIFCKLLRTNNEMTKKLDKRINELIEQKMKN